MINIWRNNETTDMFTKSTKNPNFLSINQTSFDDKIRPTI